MAQTRQDGSEWAHLVGREVAALAEDRPRQRLVERILVCVRVGAHGLDERLAREGTVGEVVGAGVRVEYAHL